MADTKTSLLRLAGRAFAKLIKHVERTSEIVTEPADLKARLRATHPCVVVGWHGQFMMTACLHPGDIRVAAIVARHGDAEALAAALERLDTHIIRGAGAGDRKRDRGGVAALRLSVKALLDGASLVMTADAPPGPARVAGPGVIMIAKLSGRPLAPVAAATSRFASFDTWSRLTINLPYSRLAFVGGEPIYVPRDADAAMMEAKRLELETALNDVTRRAYALARSNIDRATPKHILAARNPPPPGLRLKAYRVAMAALRPAAPLLLDARGRRGKEDPTRRGERLGAAVAVRPAGRVFWLHAASVGETLAVLPLIDDILAEAPDAHVLLTTGTTTSAELARTRLPPRAMHQYVPLDVPQFVRAFLDHWRPDIGIFTESDIWPNLVLETAARNIPLVLINARMSPRSQRRWRKNARLGRPLFSRFKIILAQDAGVARTLLRLGAPKVVVSGNLKIDAPAPTIDAKKLAELRDAVGARPVFLASSTHPGEEAIIAAAHKAMSRTAPGLLTIVAPRHPARGVEIANLFESLGLAVARRSLGALPTNETDIYIADTIGELGALYTLAPVSFIGGSLIPHGGQNPIEAVRCGSVVVSGSQVHNFRDIYGALVAAKGAAFVGGADEIADVAGALFSDASALARMRADATAALAALSGARAATMSALKPFLTPAKE